MCFEVVQWMGSSRRYNGSYVGPRRITRPRDFATPTHELEQGPKASAKPATQTDPFILWWCVRVASRAQGLPRRGGSQCSPQREARLPREASSEFVRERDDLAVELLTFVQEVGVDKVIAANYP
jgi:hypothetical protein